MTDVKLCRNGLSCAFRKNGACKYTHSEAKTPAGSKASDQKSASASGATKVRRARSSRSHAGNVPAGGGPIVRFGGGGVALHLVRQHAQRVANATRILALRKSQTSDKSFMDVKTGKSVSTCGDLAEVSELQEQLTMLKTAAKISIGSSKVRANLYLAVAAIGGANSTIAGSYPLVPSAAAEWASFATLYDEVKVHSIEVHHLTGLGVGATANAAASAVWSALGYDSTYNSTPASAADVLESTQSVLTAAQTSIAATVLPSVPHRFHIRIPSGPVANSTAVTGGTGIIANFPGEWMAMGDTADSVGYLRYFIEAGGTTNVMGYKWMLVFNCEFRERT